jgi:hypothetical protein
MLKKLRSIFVVDEDLPAQATDSPTESNNRSSTGTGTAEAEVDDRATVKVEGGEVNEKFLNVLLGAIEKNDLEGFDYLEFKRFLKSLEKVELDEATKFRTAYATGQTMGASKEKLVSSAERYLGILQQENERFEQAVLNQRSKVVDDKQSGITNLEQVIREKEEKIAQLTKEISEAREEINRMREEVALGQAKILQTQSDFKHTYQHLMEQLQSDIGKINEHLK